MDLKPTLAVFFVVRLGEILLIEYVVFVIAQVIPSNFEFFTSTIFLGIAQLTQKIAETSTSVSLIAMAIFGLSYLIGYLLKGSPVPWRDIKEFGNDITNNAIRSAMMLALWSSIVSLLLWIVSVISLAGD